MIRQAPTRTIRRTCVTANSLNPRNKEKKFFFSYPHTLTIPLERPVYRGFNGEGRCEGKIKNFRFYIQLKSLPEWRLFNKSSKVL